MTFGSPTSGLKHSPGPRGACVEDLYMYSLVVLLHVRSKRSCLPTLSQKHRMQVPDVSSSESSHHYYFGSQPSASNSCNTMCRM